MLLICVGLNLWVSTGVFTLAVFGYFSEFIDLWCSSPAQSGHSESMAGYTHLLPTERKGQRFVVSHP